MYNENDLYKTMKRRNYVETEGRDQGEVPE